MDDDIIMIGPIRFNPLRNEVELPDKTVRLTPNEARILSVLATHANTVCTFSQIISAVWGYTSNNEDTGLLKWDIRHLRYKIEPDRMNPTYILTVPGEGYKLVVPDREREK